MNALPLTLLAAPLRALFPLPIVTWALSVPLPWLEVMTPTKHALLPGTMMETWKASPQTDRWNCQPRRGVMLRSARLAPLIFPNYPLCFPSIFPMFHLFIYQNPRTATLVLLTTFKPYLLRSMAPFLLPLTPFIFPKCPLGFSPTFPLLNHSPSPCSLPRYFQHFLL